ncbi:TPA: hypothetical protein ACGM8Z_001909 [Streptococcus agalactiae]|uniref:hypothetical protein n=1 Tax=Streptococcus TaxID=1301 RepID=UPI0021F8D101|nr:MULTISPECIES: hypothetical protein [Streptococcus]HEQ0508032.1 hypothetical protein [Streptococcus pyogenes]MCW0972336.1 hypothetical protein [Streptococcus anginosus]MCW1030767.1 hypothetical protein [Streptococcus anginosus]MCW1040359.1 hypothetical protein [Streptococcus anginosus]MCY7043225.1 hypothetical protein [Streptococcus vestibularis]
MARKNISKIDKDLEEALAKVEQLKAERKESEDNFYKEIGRLVVQKEKLFDKNITFEKIIDGLKNEIKNRKDSLLKKDQQEKNGPQNFEGQN